MKMKSSFAVVTVGGFMAAGVVTGQALRSLPGWVWWFVLAAWICNMVSCYLLAADRRRRQARREARIRRNAARDAQTNEMRPAGGNLIGRKG